MAAAFHVKVTLLLPTVAFSPVGVDGAAICGLAVATELATDSPPALTAFTVYE